MTPLPTSAVPSYIGAAGLVGFSLAAFLVLSLDLPDILNLAILVLLTGVPMWVLEYYRNSRPRETNRSNIEGPSSTHIRWRIRGLMPVAALWLLTTGTFTLAGGANVSGFWEASVFLLPVVLIVAWQYIYAKKSVNLSGIERIGRWLTDDKSEHFPWACLRDQLVKAFFLPLMIAFAYEWGAGVSWKDDTNHYHWFFLSLGFLYIIDTVFAIIGYLSTANRIDAHIRSSNPYWSGWAFALVCYPPFFYWLKEAGFNYRDGYQWFDWLGNHEVAALFWASAIILLTAIYAWATVIFGVRFSNLTNRGIITNGPYKYTKHPAYISKNLSWWMISVPFISNSGSLTAMTHCLVLLAINGIYWARAKTEEKHLMNDPDYCEYVAWIASNGLFTRLKNTIRGK